MIVGNRKDPVRFSFVNVWEPKAMEEGGRLTYSVQVVIPKSNTALVEAVKKAIENAKVDGIKKSLFNEAATKNPAFRAGLRDGDQEAAEKENGSRDYLKGCYFFNASSSADQQPKVVNSRLEPIMRRDDFYSGCYGIADINFYAFKYGKGGVAAGLNSIMKTDEGDRLDGRQSAEQAFGEFADTEGESEGQLT